MEDPAFSVNSAHSFGRHFDGTVRAPGALRATALAAITAAAYFLAARLGLALLTEPEGVAVFWPASGVAAGILITLGAGARAPVAIGIFAATIAANLLGDRSLLAAVSKGFCNAGEAVFTAWLIARWFGQPFRLDDLDRVLGFLAASALGAAVAAVGGAAAMGLFHTTAPVLGIWRAWFLADGLGIVTIAPLVIGIAQLLRAPPSHRELVEGALALVALVALSAATLTAPPGLWVTFVPVTVLFPLLLLVAARYRPEFAACSAFIVAIGLVLTTTFGIGRFGDASAAIADRVHAAQFGMLVTSLCALVLAALFAERRRSEAALGDSNERLRLALAGADLGVWSMDLATGRMQNDARDRRINGHDPDAPVTTLAEARSFVHGDDLAGLDTAFEAAARGDDICRAEYRVRPPGQKHAGQVRWVAVEGTVVRDAAGRPMRMLGVTRDITEGKLAEAHRNLLIAELDHRVKNALAIVSAVATRTQETSGSTAEFIAALNGRIKSMAATHELLSDRQWQGLPLAQLVTRELAPYATAGNTSVEGPDLLLSAEAGQAIAMVLHELATNAAKFGALASPRGRVSVRWLRRKDGNGPGPLVMRWQEIGGPPVAVPARSGYGTSVICDLIPYELGGTVDVVHAREGLRCSVEIPAAWLGNPDRPRANGAAAAAPVRAEPPPPSRRVMLAGRPQRSRAKATGSV
jgi:PAS domain S-box-containing protein